IDQLVEVEQVAATRSSDQGTDGTHPDTRSVADQPVVSISTGAVASTPENEGGTSEATADGGSGTITAPVSADPATTAQARADAAEQARLAEASLSAQARRPLRLYETFLSNEGAVLPETTQDAEMEPRLLAFHAERARNEAAAMERRSIDLADQATLLADSAANAKKRDREHLEKMASMTRAASDSAHAASLAKAAEAQLTMERQHEAEKAAAYRERLVKYYYLTSEEQDLVMENADRSRYFQVKTRALEQYDAAEEASNAAASNREVGRILQQQAREANNAGLAPTEAIERMRVLDQRASALLQRADSLDDVSARLRGAAAINENQASVLLQGMTADRSTELMALEMRTRRTEPILAGIPPQAAAPLVAHEVRQGTGQQDAVAVETRPVAASPIGAQRTAQGVSSDPSTERNANTEPPPTAQPVIVAAAGVRDTPVASASVPTPVAAPATLVTDVFELRPAVEHRAVEIPKDVVMPSGIVYKVQIGAFRNAIPQEAFSDMTPVTGETVGNGLTRYTAGMFVGFDGAAHAKDQVRERGYRDAFIVAYRDGKRIPLGEAMRATRGTQVAGVEPTRDQPVVMEQIRPVVVEPVAQRVTPVIDRPVATTPVIAQEDLATVLATYPATAEEVIGRFAPAPEATAYYNVPGAAPARQVETVRGLFFTVQVGVYSKPVALDRLFNITPLNSELTETAKVRYTTGIYMDMEQARLRKDEAVTLGVKDAFMTAYLNGKRIPMREASALLEKFGPAILATP
ncbi:MAG TPA: hypothetical protein VKG92_09095, partial [Flavobacteriales bacterium]|nr:hypothetical protein [Flavobacteriales bacterium]